MLASLHRIPAAAVWLIKRVFVAAALIGTVGAVDSNEQPAKLIIGVWLNQAMVQFLDSQKVVRPRPTIPAYFEFRRDGTWTFDFGNTMYGGTYVWFPTMKFVDTSFTPQPLRKSAGISTTASTSATI